jgi:glutamate-5-semialdehyde dehydrogenase
LQQVLNVVIDSKTQYPAACNACETLLIHKDAVSWSLPPLLSALREKKVKLRGCQQVLDFVSTLFSAAAAAAASGAGAASSSAESSSAGIELVTSEQEWSTEYSDLILAIRIVDSVKDAIMHINTWGSHHTGFHN